MAVPCEEKLKADADHVAAKRGELKAVAGFGRLRGELKGHLARFGGELKVGPDCPLGVNQEN